MKSSKLAFLPLFIALVLPQIGRAQVPLSITNGLYDTGVNAAGQDFGGGVSTTNELHYLLVSEPAGAPTPAVTVHSADAVDAGWTPNVTTEPDPPVPNSTARWISPSAKAAAEPTGIYDYQLTLTGIPTSQLVTITADIASAGALSVYANGNGTVGSGTLISTLASDPGATTVVTMSFVSSITGTTDTLDFDVDNPSSADATGLFIYEISGSYSPVPEPRQWASIVLLGLGGLVLLRKLRDRFPARALPA